MRVVFWGIGRTAERYLNEIEEIYNKIDLVGFTGSEVESTSNKVNLFMDKYAIISISKLKETDIDYICILSNFEKEIREKIHYERIQNDEKVILFEELRMICEFEQDIEGAYDTMEKCMPYPARRWFNRRRTYEYFKRKYWKVLFDKEYKTLSMVKKIKLEKDVRPVWVLWMQGIENAPEVVKVCIDTIRRSCGKGELLFVLDKKTIGDYIELPNYIIKKYEEGIIDDTHLSDIIRLRLLNVYGGIWIDSTVFVSASTFPNYLRSGEFVMVPLVYESYEPKIATNWLMASQCGNKMLLCVEALLNSYWQEESELLDYHIFHIFTTLVANTFPKEWHFRPNIVKDAAELLAKELNEKYDSERYEQITKMSDFHKLSYKHKEVFEDRGVDTFWNHLKDIVKKERTYE